MVKIRLMPRDKVLALIKREFINNFVNRAVPEVNPISLSQLPKRERLTVGRPAFFLKFWGIRSIMK
jgi:hypothetical protein